MANKFWDKSIFSPADVVKILFYAIGGAGLFFGLRSEIRDEKQERQKEIELLKLRVSYLESTKHTVDIDPDPVRKTNREHNEIFIAGIIPNQISLPSKFRRK